MRIAIVGSGVSGLVAGHLLSRSHEVHVFEADARVGGHTNTLPVELGGRSYAVDTGFIVFNDWTYPNFIRLLDQLGVAWKKSDMSFSVKSEVTGLEYNGTSLNSLFAQRANVFRPSFLGMVRDILRFNSEAPALLEAEAAALVSGGPGDGGGPTLAEYLQTGGYGEAFVRDYILPMGGAIWSASTEQMLAFPARFFVRFFSNHGMLSVDERPTWRVVEGGSGSYLEPLCRPFADRIQTSSPVEHIVRSASKVQIQVAGRAPQSFDHVVIATHSDTALGLLADPSDAEREVLGALPYQANVALLHTDASLMPRKRLAWAAWNYHLLERSPQGPGAPVSVTYWMNRLQGLDAPQDVFVTLNRDGEIAPEHLLARIEYAHPTYTSEGVTAQGRWSEISGQRGTHYCGAYWSWGFHEDGVRSGLRVAAAFGEEL